MFDFFDLTHPINEHMPTWHGDQGFKKVIISDYPNPRNILYTLSAGVGTHMDAPSHFIAGGRDIEQFQIKELFAPLCIVDVRKKAHENYFVSLEDIHEYEKNHGKIAAHSVVCALTGWSSKWNTPTKYRNADSQGKVHVPGFAKVCGPLFLERNIAGLGIDTLSPDGSDNTYPLHHLLLGAGKFFLENLTNLEALPPQGAHILIVPLKVEGAAEAPVRAFGIKMRMKFLQNLF